MFQHIIQPMHEQFKGTLGSATVATAQGHGVKRMVLRYLYVLRGVAAAFTAKTASLYFGVFSELLGPLAGVIKLYSTSPEVGEVVLRLVGDLITRASPLLPGPQKGALFQSAAAVLQQYATAYGGGAAGAGLHGGVRRLRAGQRASATVVVVVAVVVVVVVVVMVIVVAVVVVGSRLGLARAGGLAASF